MCIIMVLELITGQAFLRFIPNDEIAKKWISNSFHLKLLVSINN